MHKTITFKTTKKEQLIDITHKVQEVVNGIKDGLCCIYALGATAGIIVNENADPELCDDVLDALDRIAPEGKGYRHDRIDDNAPAHIKSAFVGPSVTVPIVDGQLTLSTWQAIMFAEFDGPRNKREIIIKIIQTSS